MRWDRSGGAGDGHELLPELLCQSVESALFGLQDLGVVVGQALLDVVVAFDHDAPVPGGEFASQRHGGDEPTAPGGHAPIKATQGDVFAAHQRLRHHAKELTRAIAPALGPSAFALAAVVAARGQSGPRGEVLLGGMRSANPILAR